MRSNGVPRVLRLSPRAYQRLTFFVLLALGFIIVTGAAVRLTGSGLGCSEWPNCEQGRLVAPLEVRPMIEFVNRLITGLVSAAVIVAVLGSLVRTPRRRDLTWWSLGLVGGVIGQILLGGYTVRYGLAPQLVTAHFLVSIVLVWNGIVLYHRAGRPDGPTPNVVRASPTAPAPAPASATMGGAQLLVAPRVKPAARVLVALSAAVLVTGTVVTATGPHAGDERAPRYDFAITDVARIHSVTAWLFLAAAVWVLWQLKQTGAPLQVDSRARRLVVAILFQGGLGYAQYVAGVPPYLVIIHVLGSVLVFAASLDLYLSLFARPLDLVEGADRPTGRAATVAPSTTTAPVAPSGTPAVAPSTEPAR